MRAPLRRARRPRRGRAPARAGRRLAARPAARAVGHGRRRRSAGGDRRCWRRRRGVLHDHFVNLLLANLDAGRRRVPDPHLDPRPRCTPSCARPSPGVADAAERLARLARDTPVFAAGEASDWLRMHALARDELRAPLRAAAGGRAGGAARARRRRAGGARAARGGRAACARGRSVARRPTTWPSAACTNR